MSGDLWDFDELTNDLLIVDKDEYLIVGNSRNKLYVEDDLSGESGDYKVVGGETKKLIDELALAGSLYKVQYEY